jgi:hypothetical protein
METCGEVLGGVQDREPAPESGSIGDRQHRAGGS